MEVVASLSQGRTAAGQCGLFTHKSVPVIFEPPCISLYILHLVCDLVSASITLPFHDNQVSMATRFFFCYERAWFCVISQNKAL